LVALVNRVTGLVSFYCSVMQEIWSLKF